MPRNPEEHRDTEGLDSEEKLHSRQKPNAAGS